MLEKLKRMDWLILFILLCFMAISTICIHSATSGTRYEGLHIRNMKMYAAFFAPMLALAVLDYRLIVKYLSHAAYVLSLALLVLVMFMGESRLGAQRWLEIGNFDFQPSELAKLCLILILAYILARREGQPLDLLRDILPIGAITAVPFILVLRQPDLGTSLVLICILIGMLWVAHIRMKHVLIFLCGFIIAFSSIAYLYVSESKWFEALFEDHQIQRIETFLDPTIDPDKSWHVTNSKVAISMGQMFGQGWGKGYYVQNDFIPYHYSDSIFVIIGEEFGFLGSAVLLMLYFLLIYQMIKIAIASTDLAGTYLIIGVISMLLLQIFENIGMHIGLLPLTGIPLPFISYGGSSLMMNMLSIGFVLSVKMHQDPRDSLLAD